VGLYLGFSVILTPPMALPGVYNSSRRTSVSNRLLGVFSNLGKIATYMGFSKSQLLLEVFKTLTIAWGFQNPYYCLGFSKPLLLLGVFKIFATTYSLKTSTTVYLFVFLQKQ